MAGLQEGRPPPTRDPPREAPGAAARLELDRLAAVLQVLANASRLDLLRQLRLPRTAREVTLSPLGVADGENPDRPISRQAARIHLTKLADIGVVVARRARRGHTVADEYVLNQQRLFAIVEEMRQLASLRPYQSAGPDPTMEGRPPGSRRQGGGVRLVLVHGLEEGRSYPLTLADHGKERGWVIGRRPDVAVCLDYDPFISSENSEITFSQGSYRLHELRSSRNGTYLNWEPLAKGEARELRTGDVIGVGRSLLLFQRD